MIENYYQLQKDKAILKIDLQEIKHRLKDIYNETKRQFKKENKHFIRFMDILLILSLLLYMGGVFATNTLTMKVNAERNVTTIFRESNPRYAELAGLESVSKLEEANRNKVILAITGFWILIAFGYFYVRTNLVNKLQMYSMFVLVGYTFIRCLWHFCNDFGFYFGKVMFG